MEYNYINEQFKRIGFYDIKFYPIDEYDITNIKLSSFRGKTNWLNITNEQVKAICLILNKE